MLGDWDSSFEQLGLRFQLGPRLTHRNQPGHLIATVITCLWIPSPCLCLQVKELCVAGQGVHTFEGNSSSLLKPEVGSRVDRN